jgi:hypothetical protein
MLKGMNGDEDGAGRGRERHRLGLKPVEAAEVPFIILALFLFLGGGLIAVAVIFLEHGIYQILAEHMGSAFIVASLIGFTYEWFVHRKRDEWLNAVTENQLRATVKGLDAFVATTPREIFSLLRDIATRAGKIPTLYTPAREEGHEYTFADSIPYFRSLVAARRSEVVDVLREWIREDSNPRLKFLASDFVGEFQLHELREELESQLRLDEWDKMGDVYMKGWQLNYAWAASRANTKFMYASLAGIARKTIFEEIERWILFIPKQMKDREFLKVISSYLRREDLSAEKLVLVVHALVELHEADRDGVREVFSKFREKFNQPEVIVEVENTWRRHMLPHDSLVKMIQKGRRTKQALASAPPRGRR